MSTTCQNCNSSSIEIDPQQGNSFCTVCGTVLEENTIVAEITFGEASSGAAIVQGSYVGADQGRARTSGPYRKHATVESREQTIYNGRRNLQALSTALRLPDRLTESAQRYFNLAISHNFIQGRRNQHVVAACLYIVCRMEKTSHMLIDFSDVLQISVFTLGSTFVRLVKELSIQGIPLIDPSIYITRFAAMLEFGSETHKIASDAMRLVSRMNRDWMQTGRRPAGICGACILLAARMNNFQRSVQEVIQVVKIADTTLRKRLEEFKETPSGALTVQDFRNMWLENEFDPPSFMRSQKRDKVKGIQGDKSKKRKRQANEDWEDDDRDTDDEDPEATNSAKAIVKDKEESAMPEDRDEQDGAMDDNREQQIDTALEGAVTEWMDNPDLQTLSADMQKDQMAKEELAMARYAAQPDTLSDLDDEELDQFVLSEEEVAIKTRVWMEFNRDYLEQQRDKKLREQDDQRNGIAHPRKRKRHRPRDSTAADLAGSAEEATRKMLAERKFSKKINYEAVKSLFDSDGNMSIAPTPAPGSPARSGSVPGTPRAKMDLKAVAGDEDDGDWRKGLGGIIPGAEEYEDLGEYAGGVYGGAEVNDDD